MFDSKKYVARWQPGMTEAEILALISECGGEAGKVEESKASHTDGVKTVTRVSRCVPIYDGQGRYCGGPVDYAYISELVA